MEFDAQVDRSAPKNLKPQFDKACEAILNHQDRIACQRSGHACEAAAAIGNQDLWLTLSGAYSDGCRPRSEMIDRTFVRGRKIRHIF